MDAKQIKNTRRRLRRIVTKGVLMNHCQHNAIVELLMFKGIFSEDYPTSYLMDKLYSLDKDFLPVLDYLCERNARLAGFPHYSEEVISASHEAGAFLYQLSQKEAA